VNVKEKRQMTSLSQQQREDGSVHGKEEALSTRMETSLQRRCFLTRRQEKARKKSGSEENKDFFGSYTGAEREKRMSASICCVAAPIRQVMTEKILPAGALRSRCTEKKNKSSIGVFQIKNKQSTQLRLPVVEPEEEGERRRDRGTFFSRLE